MFIYHGVPRIDHNRSSTWHQVFWSKVQRVKVFSGNAIFEFSAAWAQWRKGGNKNWLTKKSWGNFDQISKPVGTWWFAPVRGLIAAVISRVSLVTSACSLTSRNWEQTCMRFDLKQLFICSLRRSRLPTRSGASKFGDCPLRAVNWHLY